MSWPDSWDARLDGTACPMCTDGRPSSSEHGVRVLEGEYIDAYVGRRAAQRGYVVAIWRGRHVTDLCELSADELAGFWREVVRVSAALREHYRPRKINYELLGNQMPHLHVHVTARFASGDVAPGGPLPADRSMPLSDAVVDEDADALARILQREN